MSKPMDESDVKRVLNREFDDRLGNLAKVGSALRNMNTGAHGLIARLFAYVRSLEDRIAELESRADDR